MNFIKSDRIAKNSLYAFIVCALCFCVSLLLNLTGLRQIFIFRQFITYIPYCFMAAALAFLSMTLTRIFVRAKPTRVFYLILFAVFALLAFDKIVFLGASRVYDIFRVIGAASGLFCAMVAFDRFCDTDLNDLTPKCKN